jgi:hypothetical protein
MLLTAFGLTGCVSTASLPAPQHVNLSAENVELAPVADAPRTADFGIDAVANESDSLEDLQALPGLRIRAVRPQSPAQAAGLQVGDVILSINGIETNEPDTLASIAEAATLGDRFVFEVRRDTVVLETELEAPRRVRTKDPDERYRVDPVMTRAGYRTELVQTRDAAIPAFAVARITRLFPQSPLPAGGLQPGDAIVALEGAPVTSAQHLINRLAEHDFGDRVVFRVLPGAAGGYGEFEEVAVRLWDPGRRISAVSLKPLFHYENRLGPSTTKFSLLDFWLFSVYAFERHEGEREHRLLSLFRFATGYGELIEETPEAVAR